MTAGRFAHGRKFLPAILLAIFSHATLALSLGRTAPEATLALRSGSAITLSQLRGQVVMLNFWSSWCGPCREEFPILDGIYRDKHAAGLVLVGVDVDSYKNDAAPFLSKHPVSFPIALDLSGTVAARFDQDAMPMTVLIDRRGTVRWIHRGYNTGDEQEYDAEINALLRE